MKAKKSYSFDFLCNNCSTCYSRTIFAKNEKEAEKIARIDCHCPNCNGINYSIENSYKGE